MSANAWALAGGLAACAVCTYAAVEAEKAAAKEKKKQRKKKRRAVSGATRKQSRALEKAVKEARAGRRNLSAKVMEGLWEQYDTDQSGDLDRKEMEPLVKEVVQIMRFDLEDMKEKFISETEREIMAKSDGVVSAIMTSAMLEPIKQQIAEMERQQSALMERIIHAPQNTIDQLFRQIDSNSDGRIVKEEFLANGAEVLARLLTRFEFKRPKEWG